MSETGFGSKRDRSVLEVMDRRCGECLFGLNRLVTEERAEQIIAAADAEESFFQCHKGTLVGRDVCCRGFYDLRSTIVTRLADFLGVVRWVSEADLRLEEPT